MDIEVIEIYYVQIRLHPRRNNAPVAVAAPVRKQRGDETGIADEANMCPSSIFWCMTAKPRVGLSLRIASRRAGSRMALMRSATGKWAISL